MTSRIDAMSQTPVREMAALETQRLAIREQDVLTGSKWEEVSRVQNRPQLPPPTELSSYEVVKKIIEATDAMNAHHKRDVERGFEHLKEVQQHFAEKKEAYAHLLQEIAQKNKEKESWSIYYNVLTSLISASSLITGGFLLTTGIVPAMIAGGLMAGGGALSLLVMILQQLGYDSSYLSLLYYLGIACNVVGGALGAFGYAYQIPYLMTNIAQSTLSLVRSATVLGKGTIEAQRAAIETEETLVQGKLVENRKEQDKILAQCKKALESEYYDTRVLSRIVSSDAEMKTKIQGEILANSAA